MRARARPALGVLAAMLLAGCTSSLPWPTGPVLAEAPVRGLVVDLGGHPVAGATVTTTEGATTTDATGWFTTPPGRGARWVDVAHPEFLPRTRAASHAAPVLVRLSPDDGETVTLHFGGDVMFGRRYLDRNEDGDPRDALVRAGHEAEDQAALLAPVRPLLRNAMLTVVNLESPLTTVETWHRTKEFVFKSHPSAARALRDTGVDIVDLGNNHQYDTLEQGVADTLRHLDQAEVGRFGAGPSAAEAWKPALRTVRGQTLAFLGCTSITGAEHAVDYVASDAPRKGGAAACDEERIRREVRAARAASDMVVFMVHGGFEYGRDPSENVQALTRAAREAGAALVVNHHPHVVGGFDWDGTSLVAWTLGNLLFDQTVWPTFESYLLAVHVRRGEVVRAYAEPLMVEGYVPKGLVGDLAGFVARGAAGRWPGPFVVEDGAMEVDLGGRAAARNRTLPVEAPAGAGVVVPLREGWLAGVAGPGAARPGRDLLWTGSFEDEDVDGDHLEGALWNFDGAPQRRVVAGGGWQGTAGARIERAPSNDTAIVLAPIHRILVQEGTELTLLGKARASPGARFRAELSWYPDTKGPSLTQTVAGQPAPASAAWEDLRVDARAPPGTVAVGLFLKLDPPAGGTHAWVAFDDLRLVAWAPEGAPPSPQHDHARIAGSATLTLRSDALPGPPRWPPPAP